MRASLLYLSIGIRGTLMIEEEVDALYDCMYLNELEEEEISIDLNSLEKSGI